MAATLLCLAAFLTRVSFASTATKPFAGSSYAECNPGVVYTLADVGHANFSGRWGREKWLFL